jgi:hypothetical protein
MKIVEKEKEDEGNWPNYTLENGWRIVIENPRSHTRRRYYLVANSRDIAWRELEGGWCVVNDPDYGTRKRYPCRREAVITYAMNKISQ